MLGLLVLTSGSAFGWGKQARLTRDAAKAEAMGHRDMAGWIRSGDLKRYKIGPAGVKVVGRSGAVTIQTFAPRDIHLTTDVIPAGSRVALEPTHRGAWFKSWTKVGDRRVRITEQDLPLLRRYMTEAVGEAP